MNLFVTKRDGTKEEFDAEKIARVVTAAGLEPDKSNMLAQSVESWLRAQKDTSLTTLQVRDQVLKELRELDPYAANMYSWYQKTKE